VLGYLSTAASQLLIQHAVDLLSKLVAVIDHGPEAISFLTAALTIEPNPPPRCTELRERQRVLVDLANPFFFGWSLRFPPYLSEA
jgi:hypothetical protein